MPLSYAQLQSHMKDSTRNSVSGRAKALMVARSTS